MTRLQLKQKVRNRLSEDNTRQIAESFWLDADLDEYIDTITEEIARETDCIQDQFLISAVTTTLSYDLDSSILNILRVKPEGQKPLKQSTTQYMDATKLDWETESGELEFYILDYIAGKLTFDKLPEVDIDVTLHASRLPLADIASDDDSPEIPSSYHRFMIPGILYLCTTKYGAPPTFIQRAAEFKKQYNDHIETIKQESTKASPKPINWMMVDTFGQTSKYNVWGTGNI